MVVVGVITLWLVIGLIGVGLWQVSTNRERTYQRFAQATSGIDPQEASTDEEQAPYIGRQLSRHWIWLPWFLGIAVAITVWLFLAWPIQYVIAIGASFPCCSVNSKASYILGI